MKFKYVPRLIGRAVGKRVFTYRDPEGKNPDITLDIKPGENDIDDSLVMKVLGNSAFLRLVSGKGIDSDALKAAAKQKVVAWAKDQMVDAAIAKAFDVEVPAPVAKAAAVVAAAKQ